MVDFKFSSALIDFSATSVSVVAVSEAAKALLGQMFGQGAVSVEMPKSKAGDLTKFFEQKRLNWEVEN